MVATPKVGADPNPLDRRIRGVVLNAAVLTRAAQAAILAEAVAIHVVGRARGAGRDVRSNQNVAPSKRSMTDQKYQMMSARKTSTSSRGKNFKVFPKSWLTRLRVTS